MKYSDIARLTYEAVAVKKLHRVGFQILGNGEEPLGEHIFTTSVISYFLAKHLKVDMKKVLLMSIFHDFHEARTGDIHKLQSLYVTRNTKKANEDLFKGVDDDLLGLLEEYEARKTLEARIVYEANVIALLVALKPIAERGDPYAQEWLESNAKRLRLPEAKALAKELMSMPSQDFWKRERDLIHEAYTK